MFFSVSLSIFKILKCPLLIFHGFHFSCHIPGHAVFVSHFPRFSVFCLNSRSYSINFSFSTNFIISCHILGPTVNISQFPRFSLFLAIFQLIHCLCLIFHVFQVFFFCVFLPLSRSYSVRFTLFQVFQFSCHIPAPKVWISHFPHFTVFFAIFHSLQYVYLIFHVFQFSCHILGPWLCISHFPPFLVFLAILKALPCEFLIFFRFPGLSPYSRSYSVHFSFSTFFSFTRHITGPIVCVFHFPRFSFFLP